MLKQAGGGIHDSLFFKAPQFVYCDPMSTAMVRIYTPEGFVIAADGYPSDSRKIFPANSPACSLAYGLVGWGGVYDDEAGWSVSWAEECQEIASQLAEIRMKNLGNYAKTLAQKSGQRVAAKLAQARTEGKISEDDYSQKLLGRKDSSIHFVGYFKGVPKMVVSQIRFDLPDSSASLAHSPEDCDPYVSYLFGSAKIRDLLLSPREPLIGGTPEILEAMRYIWNRYRTANLTSLIQRHEVSLPQAIEAAKDYIDACKDPEARKIDQKACEEIDGQIHVATIKPNTGFEWVIEPKQAD